MTNLPRKECGTCKFWHKKKNDPITKGICEYNDISTDAQQGRGCRDWRANKYHRKSVFHEDYIDPEVIKFAEEFMKEYEEDLRALADW